MDTGSLHHGVPSTGLTVVIAFDEPLDCGWPDDEPALFTTLVAGLHLRPSVIRTHGHQHGIQLSLSPLGSRALLGLPAGALASEIVHGDDLGRIPSSLQARLQEASSWPERFALLDAHLLDGLDERARIRPELARAWDVLRRSHGGVSVEAVAQDVGLSRRRLLSAFRAEFGLPPSQVGRLARFAHARDLAFDRVPLVEVATRAGYADQAHLTRDWRTLSGMTPARSLLGVPFVQDDAAGRTAG